MSTCSYTESSSNTSLVLRDVSKFVQTSVNGDLLSSNQRDVSLKQGDVIQFGACRDSFTVHYKPIVASVPEFERKPELQSLAFRTGLPITESIERGTFLVVEEVDETDIEVRHKC